MGRIGVWAVRTLLAVAILVLVAVGLGPVSGAYRLATVLSGSMGPGMPVGSVAVLVPVDPAGVHVGDVITYQAPTDRRVVTHRVVEVIEPGPHPVLRTKGDANPSADPWEARLAGGPAWRRVAVVPHAGSMIRMLRSAPVHRATVHVVPVLLLVAMLASIWCPGRKRPRTVAAVVAIALVAAVPAALATFTTTTTASNTVGAAADWVAPSVSSTVIAKQTGYLAGAIKQGGTYYVYANVADSGNPASGIATVKTDESAVTSGQTNVSLTAGSYSVNGVSYNYRTALQTASSPLSGSKSYTITSTDALSYSRLQTGYTVTVDNTAPTVTNIATGNAAGGNHGTADIGDTITFTFSEQIDPQSILAGWTGASTSVVVELQDGGCTLVLCATDSFQIYNAGYSATLPFGSVDLGSGGYYGCSGIGLLCGKTPTAFGATGTASTMVESTNTITITLGTNSGGNGAIHDVGSNTDMTWSCTNTPYDAAGNTVSTSGDTYTEGDNDFEF